MAKRKCWKAAWLPKVQDALNTAMARTVGIPVAIATKLIANGEINTPGVHLPISKEIYKPMLKELEEHGITFIEKEISYSGY
jgi:saccharopine dehydrogenase-like NADP-dependent oxidoreductase